MAPVDEPGARIVGAADRVRILHVVESWGAGVRAATLQFAAATPEFEHHLLRGVTRKEFSTAGDSVFESVRDLPAGFRHARRTVRIAVRDLEPDVVHAHSSYAGVFVRTAIRSTPQHRIAYSPHCFAFERTDLSRPKRAIIRAVERILARNTDTLVACSPGEGRVGAAMHVGRVVYVPNVARVPALAMLEHRDPTRVVAVGRIGAQKDPEFFRDTVSFMRTPHTDLDALWIGDGDDVRSKLRLETAGIRTSGWLDTFDAQRELGQAGVYLHTARWEGFPISILEAVELGVPVIARDVPTLSGAIATPGITTPRQMARAATRLLDGGDLARQLNLDFWRARLQENTVEYQVEALRRTYRPTPRRQVMINGKWLGASQTGMQRYAGEVAKRVLEIDPRARVVVPRGVTLPEWLPAARTIRSRLRGVPFEQLALPVIARKAMLLNLAGAAPMAKREQLVVMHDVTPARFPSTFSRRFVLWYRVMNRVLAARARHLVTVSEFSRSELGEVLGIDPARFSVAPNGHEHAIEAMLGDVRDGGELSLRMAEPYVVCIGNLTPNKNLAPVTAALAAAGIPVIVIGAAGAKRVYVQESGLTAPGVWLAGRLDDAELASVLRNAKALVFPSLYEGFGLPIVEAQALSCPVIASDRASIPEVAGEGALYFDPTRPQEVVELVRGLTDDSRKDLIEHGHRNVLRFSWDRTAETILSIVAGTPAR